MVSCWFFNGLCMVSACSCIVSAWISHDFCMVFVWFLYGFCTVSALFLDGFRMVSAWLLHGFRIVSAWFLHGVAWLRYGLSRFLMVSAEIQNITYVLLSTCPWYFT